MRNRWIHVAMTSIGFLVAAQACQAQGTTTSGSSTTGTSSSLGPSLSGSNSLTGSSSSTTGTGSTSSGIATLGGNTGGGGGKGGAGAGTTIPASSDPYSSTYANPYYMGTSGVSTTFSTATKGASGSASQTYFGKAIYATASTTGTTGGGASSILNVNNGGFSTIGMSKTPPYRVVLSSNVPLARTSAVDLQNRISASLAQSPLSSKPGISMKVEGDTVRLSGQVADERERNVIEGFIRLTPGVQNVVNELVPLVTASND